MASPISNAISWIVIALSVYSILKFAFFFVLPYRVRRTSLDKAYAGRPYATGFSDLVLLSIAIVVVGAALLVSPPGPVMLLAGLFAGATLIQLFFHAFHQPVAPDREAPEPKSPLKQMSYAIQDRPGLAWKEMLAYAVIVIVGMALYIWR